MACEDDDNVADYCFCTMDGADDFCHGDGDIDDHADEDHQCTHQCTQHHGCTHADIHDIDGQSCSHPRLLKITPLYSPTSQA